MTDDIINETAEAVKRGPKTMKVIVTRALAIGNIMFTVGDEFRIQTNIAEALQARGFVKVVA
jgi:hypothetical protein